MNWIKRQIEPNLWAVGYYDEECTWHHESDYPSKAAASRRVIYLNGVCGTSPICIIESLDLDVFILYVDGRKIYVKDSRNMAYFAKLYSNLGYEIKRK